MFINTDDEAEIKGILLPSSSFWLQILYTAIRLTLLLAIISAVILFSVLFSIGFIGDKTALFFVYDGAAFLFALFCLTAMAFIPIVQGIYFKRSRPLMSIGHSLVRRLHKILLLKIIIITLCLAFYAPLFYGHNLFFVIPYRFFLFFLFLIWMPYFTAFLIILMIRRQDFLSIVKNAYLFIKTRWVKSSYCAFLGAVSALLLGIIVFYFIRYSCIAFFTLALPRGYGELDNLPLLERLPDIIPSFLGLLFGCFTAVGGYNIVMSLMFLRVEASDESSSSAEFYEPGPIQENLGGDFMEIFKNVKEVQVDLSNPERTERFGAIAPQNRAEVLRAFSQEDEDASIKNIILTATQRNILLKTRERKEEEENNAALKKPYSRVDNYPDVGAVRPQATLTSKNFVILDTQEIDEAVKEEE